MKKQKRFLRGDAVKHKHRGLGEFECYAADSSECFVRLQASGDSEKVSTALLSYKADGLPLSADESTKRKDKHHVA